MALGLIGDEIDNISKVIFDDTVAEPEEDESDGFLEGQTTLRDMREWFYEKVWSPLETRTIFLVFILTVVGCIYGKTILSCGPLYPILPLSQRKKHTSGNIRIFTVG